MRGRLGTQNFRSAVYSVLMAKDPWGGIEVTNLEGEQVELAQQWKDQRVVLFLVRRFG